jgi:hypothetical protein
VQALAVSTSTSARARFVVLLIAKRWRSSAQPFRIIILFQRHTCSRFYSDWRAIKSITSPSKTKAVSRKCPGQILSVALT